MLTLCLLAWEHFNNFIEVYLTDHRAHSFPVCNLIIFSDFKEWYNHCHKSILEHFHPLDKNPQEHVFVCLFEYTQRCADKTPG